MRYLRIALPLYFVLLTLFPQGYAASAGTLCISPIPNPNNLNIGLGNPEGGDRSFKYSVQVDDGDIVELGFNRNVLYKTNGTAA